MPGPLNRRARNLEEAGINMGALMASAPQQQYRPLAARDGDVYITSWAKSGTTLMQQMFHQIRMIAATGAGDMDFDDISRMTPWEDTALLIDFDMNVAQRAQPRGFKSHREYERLPANARSGDGRLTLKGGVREVLATEMLEDRAAQQIQRQRLNADGQRLARLLSEPRRFVNQPMRVYSEKGSAIQGQFAGLEQGQVILRQRLNGSGEARFAMPEADIVHVELIDQ